MQFRRESSSAALKWLAPARSALERAAVEAVILAGVLLVLGSACAGVPGTRPSYRVVSTQRIGPLLDVRLEWTSRASVVSSDAKLSLLFASADVCTEMIKVGAEFDYIPGGLTGGLRLGEQICEAVGISALREWRDRRPRRRLTRHGDDRAQATYRVVFENADYAIIRGRFPLAGMIGWYAGEDTLALIPQRAECAAALQRQVATMEFRDTGPDPLRLVGDGGCPFAGFSRMVPALRDQK